MLDAWISLEFGIQDGVMSALGQAIFDSDQLQAALFFASVF
jgi:hypothetical protein